MEALLKLKSVLCDQEGAVSIAGSEEDRRIIQEALTELEAARAEIARLKTVPMKYRRMAFNAQLQDENAKLNQQLAAEQAKNVKLLDFIARAQVSSGVCCCGETMDGHSSPMSCRHSPVDMWDHAVGKLLDAPSDTSALETIVKKAGEKMRDRCAKEGWMTANGNCEDRVASAIRALPAVTMEDLK